MDMSIILVLCGTSTDDSMRRLRSSLMDTCRLISGCYQFLIYNTMRICLCRVYDIDPMSGNLIIHERSSGTTNHVLDSIICGNMMEF